MWVDFRAASSDFAGDGGKCSAISADGQILGNSHEFRRRWRAGESMTEFALGTHARLGFSPVEVQGQPAQPR
jgi:hypothetical protein